MSASIPPDLVGCDPFLTVAAHAVIAESEGEQRRWVECLLELRADPCDHLTPTDRALRLFAMGTVFLTRECSGLSIDGDPEAEHRLAPDQRRSPSLPGQSRRHTARRTAHRVQPRAYRNIRAETKALFGVIQCREAVKRALTWPGADESDRPLPAQAVALWNALLEDATKWLVDPLVVSSLDGLLTEPWERMTRRGY